ncbi:MAG: hypothetical protein M3Q62_00535 [Actinomycetota bacterium]|nr:hypothetical protein [Rubrobacteraceae bacterium]MBA3701226.1 hypothetical protein [Rubrobacteraceae bacterium]MDQ3182035.1 hypothetical protein [Actinomycetota bacterium]MDQ3497058.1 hypothetical protein [Actinomycetota bacterium]
MKRVTLLVTVVGVAILLASGVALAATFDGTLGPDIFVGTPVPTTFEVAAATTRSPV